jgi:thymidine phosphorylase
MPEAHDAVEVIVTKRDRGELADDQIDWVVDAYTRGVVADEQMSALAMAILLNGMTRREISRWTQAMISSGERMDFSSLSRPTADKHSTGGVGDKVSLILAPLMAACGAAVPMIAGRGLGHTGGTIDKLEAIPGYDTEPPLDRFRRVVRDAGCAIIGQTEALAPADRRLYAIRDVTATVESLPLITASILSKKLAAGLQGLVMDIKAGNGAFMRDRDSARALAQSIVEVAAGAGLPARALLSDMNQVLGASAGNALEVAEAVEMLKGAEGDRRLREVTLALCGELLALGGLAESPTAGAEFAETALAEGQAAEAFQRMVAGLGGPKDFLERADAYLAQAPVVRPLPARRSGYVRAQATREIGLAVMQLDGGRRRTGEEIDHRVGLSEIAAIGERVDDQRPLALIHAADATQAEAVSELLIECFELSDEPVETSAVLLERISP